MLMTAATPLSVLFTLVLSCFRFVRRPLADAAARFFLFWYAAHAWNAVSAVPIWGIDTVRAVYRHEHCDVHAGKDAAS